MKIILSFIVIGTPFSANAQLEIYGKFSKQGSVQPVINYGANKKIGEHLSITFFGLIRESWSQALIGLSYSPSDIISFSSSMGIEHGKSSPRYSSNIFLKKDQTTLLVLGEWGSGKNNYLYKVNLFHKYTEQFSFGFSAWRFHGLGPNFRVTIPKVQSTVWLMPAYDADDKIIRAMLGISLRM